MRNRMGLALLLGVVIAGGSAEGFGGRKSPTQGTAGYLYAPAYTYQVPVATPAYWAMPAPVAHAPLSYAPACQTAIPLAPAAPRVIPIAPNPPIPFAPPRPAPPSPSVEPPVRKSNEPPLGKSVSLSPTDDAKRAPKIVETRGPAIAPGLEKERCKVGFWNVTGRDVELVVAGKKHVLPKDRAVTLEVERQFSWQIVGQTMAQERVPEEKAFHEIVLRN